MIAVGMALHAQTKAEQIKHPNRRWTRWGRTVRLRILCTYVR